MEEDLTLIQSFPPHLRWFVQDSGDEKLLTEAVVNVFDAPLKAEQHEASFIGACIATTNPAVKKEFEILNTLVDAKMPK